MLATLHSSYKNRICNNAVQFQMQNVGSLICTHAHPGGRSFPGIAGFESRGDIDVLPLESVVCCQVEVCASGWSLVQRSSNECVLSEFNREPSIMRTPWPTRGCSAMWGVDCTHTDSFVRIFFLTNESWNVPCVDVYSEPNKGTYHGPGGSSSACDRGITSSISGQSLWDLWWTVWQWNMFCYQWFCLTFSV